MGSAGANSPHRRKAAMATGRPASPSPVGNVGAQSLPAQSTFPARAEGVNRPNLCAFPNRIRNLLEHGPPFVGASLGCAMRLLVLVVGLFLLPMVSGSATRLAWSLWGLLLLADLMAVLVHWDIQRRLRKIDGPPDEQTTP